MPKKFSSVLGKEENKNMKTNSVKKEKCKRKEFIFYLLCEIVLWICETMVDGGGCYLQHAVKPFLSAFMDASR